MCGIAGIVSKDYRFSPATLEHLAKTMADQMPYRGPDDSGVWLDPHGRCALSHRRLSIIDTSSAGHQPMSTANGKAALTYNGELYNFLELKQQLQQRGLKFQTRSDTEVLLKALTVWGTDALPRLDAMFAFGYYASEKQELLLARDIFGEKPLYYIDTSTYFAFASELHALLVLPDFDTTIDLEAIASYFSFQYVPAPQAIYRDARKLPPSSFLRLNRDGKLEISPYFTFETSGQQASGRSLDELAEELEGILSETVKRRLISDVPLGAFLSGGVDSSTIAALVTQKLGLPLKTFSIGFSGQADSEHFDAARISRHLNAEHYEQVLDGYPPDLAEHIGTVLDEPNGDSSCVPTYLVSRHARERVTVALSGDGGDELFGGYGRYFVTVDEHARKVSGDRRFDQCQPGEAYYASRILIYPDADLSRLLGKIPPALGRNLSGLRAGLNSDPRPLLNVLREHDARAYLPGAVLAKVDRMSMQHSLEVRAPLLGIDVAKFAMTLAADDLYAPGRGKLVLKRLASRYLPSDWLEKPKRGFGLPVELWSAERLLPVLRGLLLADDCRLAQWVDRRLLDSYFHSLEQAFHPYQAWALLILETWLRAHPASNAAGEADLRDVLIGALQLPRMKIWQQGKRWLNRIGAN